MKCYGLYKWHTLGSWTTVVWNIQIQYGSEELWPGHSFWIYLSALWLDLGDMTLTWQTIGSWTTIVWNMKIQHGGKEVWPRHRFWLYVHSDLTLGIWPWVIFMTCPWDVDTNCEISRSTMAVRSYGPDMDFGYVCTVSLTLDMTFIQGHDTSLGHGQQLCGILSKSNMSVCFNCDLDLRERWPWTKAMTHLWVMENNFVKHTDQHGSKELCPGHGFWYVCTVTLTLEIWHCVKVITYPLVMDNNCVKYCSDLTCQQGVIAQIWI